MLCSVVGDEGFSVPLFFLLGVLGRGRLRRADVSSGCGYEDEGWARCGERHDRRRSVQAGAPPCALIRNRSRGRPLSRPCRLSREILLASSNQARRSQGPEICSPRRGAPEGTAPPPVEANPTRKSSAHAPCPHQICEPGAHSPSRGPDESSAIQLRYRREGTTRPALQPLEGRYPHIWIENCPSAPKISDRRRGARVSRSSAAVISAESRAKGPFIHTC